MRTGPFRNPLWLLILIGVLLRALLIMHGAKQLDDPDNYIPLARSLANGEGFQLNGRPTAYRPPLYPLALAPLVAVSAGNIFWRIAIFHLALGGATVLLTALAAEGSGLSRPRSLIAAAITACDPVLVAQSRSVMTETPAAFLVAAALAGLGVRGWGGPIMGGAFLGLAALCRPSLLAGACLVVAGSCFALPGGIGQRLLRGALIALALLGVLLPWAIRNALVFGEPIWTTSHGGYTLALANNPIYYRDVLDGPPGSIWTGHDQWNWWDSVNRATAGMSEPEADRYLRDSAISLARQRPGTFARAVLARLGHFWSISPAGSVYTAPVRWTAIVWTLPLWIALLLGFLQPGVWRWPRVGAPLMVIGLTLVHAFFWTDLRMRAPIVPAIALVAASAVFPWRPALKRRAPQPAGTRPDSIPAAARRPATETSKS
jgi:4-amino-4-deoxy-L-arabinose transferase-like glycosyltransferase